MIYKSFAGRPIYVPDLLMFLFTRAPDPIIQLLQIDLFCSIIEPVPNKILFFKITPPDILT